MFIKDALRSALSPDTAARPSSSHKSSSPSKLSGLLNGRKSSRTSLAPSSPSALNSMPSTKAYGADDKSIPSTPVSQLSPQPAIPSRMSTIRTVRSFDDHDPSEDSSSDTNPSLNPSRNSAFSSPHHSTASGISTMSQQPSHVPAADKTPNTRLKQNHALAVRNQSTPALEVTPSSSPQSSVEIRRTSIDIPQRESSLAASTSLTDLEPPGTPPPDESGRDAAALNATEAHLANGWDSTIGKAGLGKTGRVINKLVSDNDALKRDLQLERLRAEESKQTARLLEDKMDRLVSEYEGRLLEANVTKTLLARKERQVENLQSILDRERKRAIDAGEREMIWKDEMERIRAESKVQVEESTNYATMMEGRYNAISSHWRDQGEEVQRAMARMRTEIAGLLEERKRDDERIETLRDLCDQQDGNIRSLRRQKEEIASQFTAYRTEQENALKDIKANAASREEEQVKLLSETKDALDKLRWALNVKEKINWAQ